jgi:hypothetical protein
MTKVRFHGPIAGFSGAMGEMVFADNEDKDRTVAYMKKHTPRSEAQLLQQERFAKAAAHAKAALDDPATLAYYETISKEKNIDPFPLAMSDWMKGPTIQPLDLSDYKGRAGDPIRVITKDNVGVVSVDFSLVKVDGTLIEKGKAVEAGVRSGHWTYTATAVVPLGSDIFIEAEAFDMAGNRTVASANPIVGQEE